MVTSSVLEDLADRICACPRKHPLRVGIDGIDASGKTTLADALVAPVELRGRSVIRASIDHFHNPRSIRYRLGPDSPEGYFNDSFNYPILISALLEPLGPDGDRRFRLRAYDVRADRPVESPVEIAPKNAVLILDGVFLQRPEIARFWDLVIFLDVPFEVALKRAIQRDLPILGSPEAVRERYLRRYIPGQQLYLLQCEPQRRADIILRNGV